MRSDATDQTEIEEADGRYPAFVYISRQVALGLMVAIPVGALAGFESWYFVIVGALWYINGCYILYKLFTYKGSNGELVAYKWVHSLAMIGLTVVLYLIWPSS